MRDRRDATTFGGGRASAVAIGLLGLAFLLAWLVLTPGAGAAEQRAAATKFTVGNATTPLGKIVVDSRGRSLYLFEADHKGKRRRRGPRFSLSGSRRPGRVPVPRCWGS